MIHKFEVCVVLKFNLKRCTCTCADADGETFGDAAGQAELRQEGDNSGAMMMTAASAAGAGGINDNLPEFFSTSGTSGDQQFSRYESDLEHRSSSIPE